MSALLETARLTLRQFTPDDVENLVEPFSGAARAAPAEPVEFTCNAGRTFRQ